MTAMTKRARRVAGGTALVGTVLLTGACAGNISTAQEVQLGQQYSAQIEQQLPMINDRAVNYYINQLGNSIARRADPRGIAYTFRVVNANEVNAFAVPGGHVYVNRGLIERAGNMSELAGVLAHEIGHVVERHSVEQMERAQTANTAASVLYGVLLGRNPSAVEQVGLQVGGERALRALHARRRAGSGLRRGEIPGRERDQSQRSHHDVREAPVRAAVSAERGGALVLHTPAHHGARAERAAGDRDASGVESPQPSDGYA